MPTTSETFRAVVKNLLEDDSEFGYNRHATSGPFRLFPNTYENDSAEVPYVDPETANVSGRAQRVARLSPELVDDD